MKILHIVAGDLSGGAARGAYWLHIGLKELGIERKIFTNSKITLGDDSVVVITKLKKDKIFNMIRRQLDSLLMLCYQKRKKIIFSSGLFGIDFIKTKEYQEADIIHLHWIEEVHRRLEQLAREQHGPDEHRPQRRATDHPALRPRRPPQGSGLLP